MQHKKIFLVFSCKEIKLTIKFFTTMKTRIITLFVAFLFIGSISNAQKKEISNLNPFTEIGLAIEANVYITQGAPQKVTIEGKTSDIEKIEFKVKGNTLEVKKKNKFDRIGDDIKIYITVKSIEAIAVAGSGNVITKSKIIANSLELSIAGSGNIEISNLACKDLEMEIAGSGDIKIAGTTVEEGEISIAGSGDVITKELPIDNLKISIAGSGDVKCNVNKKLNVSLAGSGDVAYLGNPKLNVESVGSGKVKSME